MNKKGCCKTHILQQPRLLCSHPGNITISPEIFVLMQHFLRGRLIAAPTFSEEVSSVNVGATIGRPRTDCEFAGSLDINAPFPAGRLITAPTSESEIIVPVADFSVGDGFPVPNACDFAGDLRINAIFPARAADSRPYILRGSLFCECRGDHWSPAYRLRIIWANCRAGACSRRKKVANSPETSM